LRSPNDETHRVEKETDVVPSSKLRIEDVPISRLRKNPHNARSHSAEQIAKLKASVRTFGFVVPVLADEQDMLLSGHARVTAAEQLGLLTVPAVRTGSLSEWQKRAFMIADNQLATLATWNEQLLRDELQFLSELEFDFSTIGFETAEVDLILDQPIDDKEDVLPAIDPAQPTVCVKGDLWIAGHHRILCGDALERGSYEKLLGGKPAQMVFTDMPYNVRIAGHAGGLGKIKHREFAMASGEKTPDEFTTFLTTAMRNMADFTVDGSIHDLCIDWRHVQQMLDAGQRVYWELKNICVWCKTNAGMGSFYRSQHEFICIFKNGKAPHINNIELGAHGRYRTNVWSYQGINSFGRDRESLLALHPTVKAVAVVADAIRDCSNRGDLILDPFAGSGTTVIAAEKTGRRAAVMDIDPLYIDAIIRRWQAYTHKQAIRADTEATFAECEARAKRGEPPSELTVDLSCRHAPEARS
jgi:DNA modification methylase